MIIHINNTDDFLRALRNNEEFQSAARRELLTEDLLAVPAQLVDMQKTQNAILDEQKEMRAKSDALQNAQNAILDEQKEMRKTQNAILDEQKEMRAKSDALQNAQNAILDIVATLLKEMGEARTDTRALHGMYRREHQDLQRFRGNYASDAAHKNRYQIVQQFARRRAMRRIRYNVLDSATLDALVEEKYESLDDLGLSDDALNSFPAADLVIEVTERRSSRPGFCVVVEASFTATRDDVARASERASILRCATELDTYAVVAAVRLAPSIEGSVFDSIERYLEADAPNTVVWIPIVEEDLEPPDPR